MHIIVLPTIHYTPCSTLVHDTPQYTCSWNGAPRLSLQTKESSHGALGAGKRMDPRGVGEVADMVHDRDVVQTKCSHLRP
jgi:hypothetical protein